MRTLSLLVIYVIAICGCDRSSGSGSGTSLTYVVGRQSGHPVLRLDDVSMVFRGISSPGDDTEVLGEGKVQVAGGGSVSGKVCVGDLEFRHAFVDGVLTITVGQTKLEIIEGGRSLRIGEHTIPLKEKARTVTVAEDGTISVPE